MIIAHFHGLTFSKCLITFFSNLVDCEESSDCGDDRFCNFDYDDSGFCEHCSQFEDSTCEASGFATQNGLDECKATCEG